MGLLHKNCLQLKTGRKSKGNPGTQVAMGCPALEAFRHFSFGWGNTA